MSQLLKPTCSNEQTPAPAIDDFSKIRDLFPAVVNHPEIIYFDNAATSQKPQQVIETMRWFYEDSCANANRAAYAVASNLHRLVEDTRQQVAAFLNAEPVDIAFTNGATDSLNLVADSWGLPNLQDGDQILLCLDDHQSALLPWFNVQARLKHFGKNIEIIPFAMHHTGVYDRRDIKAKITERTRLVVFSHIHHVYGLEWDVADIAEIEKQLPADALIALDASQSVSHTALDAQTLGVDFISFSGHKMFAANGTGILWVNPNIRGHLWPARLGSKSAVKIAGQGLNLDSSNLSGLIECGTLNLPGIFSLKSALEFIRSTGLDQMKQYLSYLTRDLYLQLKMLPGIQFAPGVANYDCAQGFGIISFRFAHISSTDLAQYLDQHGIYVRSGDHCLGTKTAQEKDYIRVSMQIYNTKEEIDRFVTTIKSALSD